MAELSVDTLDHRNVASTLAELHKRGANASVRAPVRLSFGFAAPPDAEASATLAGALLTSFTKVPMHVSADSSMAASILVRFGLATALQHRAVKTSFGGGSAVLGDPRLGATWTPASKAAMDAMFMVAPPSSSHQPSEELFGPKHGVFVNPHRTTARFGPASMTTLVRRWLTQRFDAQPKLLDEVSFALDQLVANIDQHAVTDSSPRVTSLARVEVDGSSDQLTLVVLDSGPGLVETLRPKDDGSFPTTGPELVQTLLDGELEGWGRGRGVGLARLNERVTEAGGDLALISGSVHARTGAKTLGVSPSVGGAVISIRLPLS